MAEPVRRPDELEPDPSDPAEHQAGDLPPGAWNRLVADAILLFFCPGDVPLPPPPDRRAGTDDDRGDAGEG